MTAGNPVSLVALWLVLLAFAVSADPEVIDEAQLEADGVRIGEIVLLKHDVFDTSDPREDKAPYRLANKLHMDTRDDVITRQILLKPGDLYSRRLVDESERILRGRRYLYDASIVPVNLRDGRVDLLVTTRDVWTLKPSLSVSRKGGENKSNTGLEERNLLGRGQELSLSRTDDVDRESNIFLFRDPHIRGSRMSATVRLEDNSDGHSYRVSASRPFYSFDTTWSAGFSLLDDERITTLYSLGDEAAEYQHDRSLYQLSWGWSAGLVEDSVRRYWVGLVHDDNEFSAVPDGTLAVVVPEDRKLIFPFVAFEWLQDDYVTTRNKDQIGRTEDFYMGARLTGSLGVVADALGSDRDALIYSATLGRGFGSIESRALLATIWASGRQESGTSANALVGLNMRYYWQLSDRRMVFATVEASRGHRLDIDNVMELGGDTGLRGYPLRYQTGESRALLTLEQRFFWDWYPWRLFRVGGAMFADVGRVWGTNYTGEPDQGTLKDVGIGLRFAPTRSGHRKMVHLDIAFPLDGDGSIDDVQILLESRSGF
ncbi:MAG: hypothetical protein QNJ40_05875 [Xanthomonadales bacterium]|nr:hypothetical protein [Xanthomonadales bacterium]